MKILALTKYGRAAASTRQRLLQYIPALRAAGMEVECQALLDDDYVRSLASGGGYSRVAVLKSYVQRLRQVLKAPDFDVLWIYAELFPGLPKPFEKLAFRSKRPVVYDFDDAFFHQYDRNARPAVRYLLRGKLDPLIRGAALCCCGNPYLRDYAAGLGAKTMILPTVVDTEIYRPMAKAASSEPPVIGWIGSPSTWRNVRPILPVLEHLARTGRARIRVIGAGAGAEADRFPELEMTEWSEAAEVDDVRRMDIGIMPLLDRPFERGKSGFKLVQYMACGLPVVASPVGVNSVMVEPEANGFLAGSVDEWRPALERLLGDASLRHRLGEEGRQRAVKDWSLAAHAPRLVGAIEALGPRRSPDRKGAA